MKKVGLFIIALIMGFALFGCHKEEQAPKEIKASKDNVEIVADNKVISLTEKISYSGLQDMGFTITDDYEDILETKIAPSKKGKNKTVVSYNVKDKDSKLLTVSVVNTGKNKVPVRDATVYFVSCYDDAGFTRSYKLPGGIKYGDTAEKIKKSLGTPTEDFSVMESGKMLRYNVKGKGIYTFNLDDEKVTLKGFSLELEDSFLFE